MKRVLLVLIFLTSVMNATPSVYDQKFLNVCDTSERNNESQDDEDYTKKVEVLKKEIKVYAKTIKNRGNEAAEKYAEVGRMYFALGENEQALVYTKKAINSVVPGTPESDKLIYILNGELAIVYYYTGEYERSADYIKKVLEYNILKYGKGSKEVGDVYFGLASLYAQNNEFQKAVSTYEKIIKTTKVESYLIDAIIEQLDLYEQLKNNEMVIRNCDKMLEIYKTAIKEHPEKEKFIKKARERIIERRIKAMKYR